MIINIPISIHNIGNLIAENIFLHSTRCMLYIKNKMISGSVKDYEKLEDDLTLMDLSPNDSVVIIVEFEFQLPNDLNLEKFPDELVSSGKMDPNFFFQYDSHYLDTQFTSNVSFEISYNKYSILMKKT